MFSQHVDFDKFNVVNLHKKHTLQINLVVYQNKIEYIVLTLRKFVDIITKNE